MTEQLILRPFSDSDVTLMERWLHAEHVAPWYELPQDWLDEIKNRHSEFSFITHMIAAIDDNPIGFCQYYDCYDSRKYENWGIDITAPGEIYSIDYLIGESEYLRCGFGKAIICSLLEILKNLGVETIIVNPDKNNEASNRSLCASGFVKSEGHYSLKL
jgi:RimJ/RimL family protein N-acetyltransferase